MKSLNYQELFLQMILKPKIAITVLFCLFSQLCFYIRAIVLPGLIGSYAVNSNINILKKFFVYFAVYFVSYTISTKSKIDLRIQVQKYFGNILFARLINNRETNIQDVPSSLFTDIYNVINESSELVDKFFSVVPFIICFGSLLFFIFNKIGIKYGIYFSLMLIVFVMFSLKYSKIVKDLSEKSNVDKNIMIDGNEDINKNLVSIISYDNFNQENRNIKELINKYLLRIKKAFFSVFILKWGGNTIICLFYVISLYFLITTLDKEIFVQYAVIYLGLIQYAAAKFSVISDFYLILGKLTNSIKNLENNIQRKEKNNIISNDLNLIKDTEHYIKVNSIYLKLGDRLLYDNLSLNFPRNKLIGVIGKIGSGKSTLLKVIFGNIEVDKGSIFKNNINFNNVSIREWRKDILYVTQHPLVFNRSLEENLAYPNKSLNENQKKLIKELELEELFKNLSNRTDFGIGGMKISGGQKQIISLFRIINDSSSLILLDEPTSDLDPKSRKIVYKLLEKIKLQNKTIIVATHDQDLMSIMDNLITIQ